MILSIWFQDWKWFFFFFWFSALQNYIYFLFEAYFASFKEFPCVFFSLFFRGLSTENPDLVQLKSLLAGLTLPVKSGSSESAAEDRDGRCSNTSHHRRQRKTWDDLHEACLSLFVFQLRIRPQAPSLWSTSQPPCLWLQPTWLNAWRRSPKEKQLRVR